MWYWLRGYIETFVSTVGEADWAEPETAKAAVIARMKEYEPPTSSSSSMELSIEPVAHQLGVIGAQW